MIPSQEILGLFHSKWLILVQIQLYFNRNVRQFTARTTTVTCIHVMLAAEGGGSIEPVEPPSLRACFLLLRVWFNVYGHSICNKLLSCHVCYAFNYVPAAEMRA